MSRLNDPRVFQRFADSVSHAAGSPWAFMLACLIVVVWLGSGPLFGFSDTWQLVINTGTTIVTFVMVFLIQSTQNRDNRAVHLKLDELIVAAERAQNRYAGIERLSETELAEISRQLHEQAEQEMTDAR